MAQKNPKVGSGSVPTTKHIDNNDMFLKRALEKLLSEKDMKKSYHQQLKRACEAALASLTKQPQTTNILSIHETYFLPFELACASKNSRMIDTSLDCLQKLLLNGHSIGNISDPIDSSKLLIDRIVSVICACFYGIQTEEKVELQIIKICLTIMTSQTIEIHQRSVLQIVKTCFNIYLTSRSKINEATAQGCLSQILNGIFSKMEQKMSVANERKRQGTISVVTSDYDEQQVIIKDILDELVEKIVYDEATLVQTNSSLSNNEIIDDTQSTQGDINDGMRQNDG
ncbi:unnamed protein product, partial [Rotaria magnacalcarata]